MKSEHLTLKWGTLKAWDVHSEACLNALRRYHAAGSVSMGAASQVDNSEQKDAICDLIDALDNDEIYLPWDDVMVSKCEAKAYVMGYGKEASDE